MESHLRAPKGWSITEKSTYENVSHYIACEKQGIAASGLVTVVWFDFERDLNESLTSMKLSLEKEIIQRGSKVNFSKTEELDFKGYSTLSINNTFSLLHVKHQSTVVTWNCNNKNVIIHYQEAIEDSDENIVGFEEIKNSFQCR